jgi:HK97 family phage major capsid protein
MSGRIVQRIYETSPMRQVASVVSIGTDALEGFNDLDEAGAEWVGERQARNDSTTPGLGKYSIPVHEIAAQPKATQKLLDDSAFDIEGWLSGKVADKFGRAENAAFVVGDGVEKPRGILTYPTAATADASRAWGTFEHVNTANAGSWGSAPNGSDKLIDLVFAVKANFRGNASWMMNRATVASVRKLKDGDGNYLWQPNFEARQGGLLLGYPIAEAEDMPNISTTNALAVAFGDFAQAYTIVDRLGIRILRDPFTDKPFIRFYTTKRVGGAAINFEAVKFLRFGT